MDMLTTPKNGLNITNIEDLPVPTNLKPTKSLAGQCGMCEMVESGIIVDLIIY